MKTLRYFFRLTFAFISRFKGLLLIGLVIGVLIYFVAFLFAPYVQSRKTEIIGISGRYYAERLPVEITSKLSSGLTTVSLTGNPEPSLASSWESPDNGLTWVFTLGEAYWHDGTLVTSQDINYNFSDVEVEKPDEKTVVFKLDDPYSPFPVIVSKPIFKQGLLGVGEWRVNNLIISQGYTQEISLINEQEEELIYKFFPNESQTKTAFKLGQINKMIGLFDISPFDTWNTVKIEEVVRKDHIVTLFFYTQSDKFNNNKPLRQALNYAVNKEELSSNRAISPINPDSWAFNPQVKSYDYDLERAKELIADVPQEEKEKPINLTTTPLLLGVAEKLKNSWEQLGLKVEIHVSTNPDSEADAFLTLFEIPTDPDQYQVWHSTQETNNISKYASDRIDGLLEEGRSETDLENRKRIYLDFQRFLLEEAPAMFLYHPTYYNISRK